MRRIAVIGIGAGNPDHLTFQAAAAIRAADVFFVTEKGGAADQLAAMREAILKRFAGRPGWRLVRIPSPPREAGGDYKAGVAAWHAGRARRYGEAIADELADGRTGAFLAWGDPAFYDSILRNLDQVRRDGLAFDLEVIPGISAPQALAAAHRIPLNLVGEPIHITTGRRLAAGLPRAMESTVVMLDDGSALAGLDPAGLAIWWGAYLGTPDQVLVAGPLAAVKEEILRIRREKRAAIGWIMDTYLLRRTA